MITPASMGDWILLAGTLATVSAVAAVGHRWVLPAEATDDARGPGQATFPAPVRGGVRERT